MGFNVLIILTTLFAEHTQEDTIQDAQKVARVSVCLAQGMIGRERLRSLD